MGLNCGNKLHHEVAGVVDYKLWTMTNIRATQFGFMPGSSNMEPISPCDR